MAQNYVVMARKNLLKPSEAPKYYAVARSGRKVTVKGGLQTYYRTFVLIQKASWKVVSESFCSKSSMYWMKGISFRWAIWGISA